MKVLIMDDEESARQELETSFRECKEMTFEIEKAGDIAQADNALRRMKFDVITIDLKLGKTVTAGLQWMQKQMILASCPEAIKIVVTAYATVDRCVKAMRLGAWDFVDKEGNYGATVVRSAVDRLREMEDQRREERFIFDEWLPRHEGRLQKEYAGQYVAIKDGNIVAHGDSMISLAGQLAGLGLAGARLPYILQVGRKEEQ
jgi:DNA-binding NtrC family response regulator